MTDCLFCKMVSGELQPAVVYENDEILAFRDIDPQAPSHILVIPKMHVTSLNDLDQKQFELLGKMYLAATEIASREGFSDSGYRTIFNCGEQGGQTVFHLHLTLFLS